MHAPASVNVGYNKYIHFITMRKKNTGLFFLIIYHIELYYISLRDCYVTVYNCHIYVTVYNCHIHGIRKN